jgi:glutathione synthase/RimK-type ligase-like ATP-grasp enzyme
MVSQRFDPHADVVEAALRGQGIESLRLDTEDVHAYGISWGSEREKFVISGPSGASVDVSAVRSCYFRPPARPTSHPGIATPAGALFAAGENAAFLEGLYAFPGIRWVSPPHLVERAAAKHVQLVTAKRLGFAVPRTVLTNDPSVARRFAASLDRDIVVKPLRTAEVVSGSTRFDVAAQRLSAAEVVERAHAVRLAPTLLQEHIAKRAEVRVTVIGRETFAVRLVPRDAQSSTDWSRVDPSRFSYEPVELSAEMTARIGAFVGWYGMQFAALDFLEAPDGELVFLENNPNGAWYWLERETGLPLTRSMVRLLTEGTPG